MPDAADQITAERVEHARSVIGDVTRRTPVVESATLTERLGAPVVLKAENLQRVGSFKIRGALNKLAALGDDCAAGVVCASAGNHAQAVALAARERGVACEVVMPVGAAVAKVEATEALGATITLEGASVTECVDIARARAKADGKSFVHPFDDPEVICGQGTLGLELLEQIPDLTTVVVPVGGGGLIGGVAAMIKAVSPGIRVIGVQARAMAAVPASLAAGRPEPAPMAVTIADGIAVRAPSALTLALIERWVDEVVTVDEDQIADAMVLLLEKAKLVVEGGGAVGVAALLSGQIEAQNGGTICPVLSGGNVDPGLLAALARRHESQAGRRHVLFTRVADRPGGLVTLLNLVADAGASIVDVTHLREGVGLHVAETGVQLVIETRSREHGQEVIAAMRVGGYDVIGALGAGSALS